MDRLFVYGIFLDEDMRDRYSMSNPQYATVRGYATVDAIGDGTIVEAIKVSQDFCLTGLVVDVSDVHTIKYGNDSYDVDNWYRLDTLEGGYDRVKVKTTDGEHVYMYTAK